MKHTVPFIGLIIVLTLLLGSSCSQREEKPFILSTGWTAIPDAQPPLLTNPKDWVPPIFPGAVADQEMQTNMTAVAATPEGLDEAASSGFGFPVHNAILYAYHSTAGVQKILDFYSEQMAAQGWKKIALTSENSTLPHQAWQQGVNGVNVTYLLVTPLENGKTLIYLSVARSDTPRPVIED